jgi:hypothetical protein
MFEENPSRPVFIDIDYRAYGNALKKYGMDEFEGF